MSLFADEIDNILSKCHLKRGSSFYIYGKNSCGRILKYILEEAGCKCNAFIEPNVTGSLRRTFEPDALRMHEIPIDANTIIIASSQPPTENLIGQFKVQGIKNIIFGREAIDNYPTPNIQLPYLEIPVVDHCNLNCAGCNHFSPLVEDKKEYKLELLKRDLSCLSKKINFKCIRIMGGEPLLHTSIIECMLLVHRFFPCSELHLVTNGLLIPTMPTKFWSVLRDCCVIIDLSVYPQNNNALPKIFSTLSDQALSVHVTGRKKFFTFFDLEGTNNKEYAWNHCFMRSCTSLWRSRLYPCWASYWQYFNKYYKKNIPVPEGIDFLCHTGKEIISFLSTPLPSCSYCNFDRIAFNSLKKSQKEVSEWTIQ